MLRSSSAGQAAMAFGQRQKKKTNKEEAHWA